MSRPVDAVRNEPVVSDLPSPAGYVDNDASKGWAVVREEYDFIRQFSVIQGRAEFDRYFQQAENETGFKIVEHL